jgi:hypothetical protein
MRTGRFLASQAGNQLFNVNLRVLVAIGCYQMAFPHHANLVVLDNDSDAVTQRLNMVGYL